MNVTPKQANKVSDSYWDNWFVTYKHLVSQLKVKVEQENQTTKPLLPALV